MTRVSRLPAMCWLAFVMLFPALSAAGDSVPASVDELDAAIEEILEDSHIPSMAWAVIQPGQAAHINTFGVKAPGSSQAVTPSTTYRIASISKMFVGIAAMRLIEQGRINPEDNVRDVLPDLQFENPWQATHPLKVKHLLESTTGWDDLSLKEHVYDNADVMPLSEAFGINPDSRVSRWAPGTRHAYSNSAAVATAMLIEQVTGQPFTDYIRDTLFIPLGFENTFYAEPEQNSDAASGVSGGQVVPHQHLLMYPSGGVSSSINDQAKLLAFFTGRGSPLLSIDSVNRMEVSDTTNVHQFDGGYGIYNFARYYGGYAYRGHDGALTGWTSELAYSPEGGYGFVILQNSDDASVLYKVGRKISDFLVSQTDTPSVISQPVPDEWKQKSGYYRFINTRIEKQYFIERLVAPVMINVEDGGAKLSSVFPPGWNRELTYAGDNRWQNEKGEIVMAAATDPLAGEVIHYGDRVLVKISAFNAVADKVVLFAWLIFLLIALLYTPVWLINNARGKITTVHGKQLRKWMSLSAVSAFVFLLALGIGMSNPFAYLAAPGLMSVVLFISSVVLPLVTVWAGIQTVIYSRSDTSRWLKGFVLIFIVLQLMVVAYLAYFSAAGIVSWT